MVAPLNEQQVRFVLLIANHNNLDKKCVSCEGAIKDVIAAYNDYNKVVLKQEGISASP